MIRALAVGLVVFVTVPAAAQRNERQGPMQLYEQATRLAAQADRLSENDHRRDAHEKWSEAAALLADALRKEPTFTRAAVLLGRVLLSLDRSSDAVATIRKTIAAGASSQPLERLLGIHLFRLQRYDEGARVLEGVVHSGKAGFDVHYLLLGHYYRTRRHERALKHATAYLAHRPKDARVHGVVGNIHLREDRVLEAIRSFRRVLELDPDNVPVRVNLGNVFHRQKQYHKAVAVYEEVLKRRPELALVHYNLGTSYHALSKWEKALSAFRSTIDLEPKNAISHYLAGECLAKLSRIDEALAMLARAAKLDPSDPRPPFAIARLAFERGDLATADEHATRAAKLVPKGGEYRALAGRIARRRGDAPRAISHLEPGARLLPTDARVRAELGRARIDSGQLDSGIDDLEAARTISPNAATVRAWLPVARTRRALDRLRGGDSEGAETDLKRALEVRPGFVDAAWNLALLLDRADRTRDGLKVVQRAIVAAPAEPDLHLLAAFLLVRVGEIETAQLAVERAGGARDVGMRWLVQGTIHGHFGEFDAAIAAFERAREGGADPGQALPLARLDRAAALLRRGRTRAGLAALAKLGHPLEAQLERVRSGLLAAGILAQRGDRARLPALLTELLSGTVPRGWGLEPLVADAELVLGFLHYRRGEERKALTRLEKHVRRFPDDPRGRRVLAVVLADLAEREHAGRRWGEAMGLVERAVEIWDGDARLRHNLACVRYSRGEHEKAAATFRRMHADGAVREASLNLALYLDDVAGEVQAPLRLYRGYLRIGGIASEVARRRAERKERIFGR